MPERQHIYIQPHREEYPKIYKQLDSVRLRLEKQTNDFSEWLGYCGATELAKAIDKLNPYLMTMEELREEIIRLGNLEEVEYGRYTT